MAKKETVNVEIPNRNSSNNGRRNTTNSGKGKGTKGKKMTRAQKKKQQRKKMLIIEVVVFVILLIVLFVWLKFGAISWDDLKNLRMNKLDDETQQMLEGYTNIALFGVDNRSNGNYESGNSDSIIICSINNETKEVKLVSVYRDTCLDVDGDSTFRKCNYAYNHGGAEEAIEMLNRNLDLDIQKYVAVDFYALIEAVDAFGGIDLEITPDEAGYMNGADGYIKNTADIAGVQNPGDVSAGESVHVSGVQAVAYCRIRYTAGSDFRRAERQRIVLEKLVAEVNNASWAELYKLGNGMFDDIGTNFTMSQALGMAKYVKDYTLVDEKGFPFDKATGSYGSAGSLVVPCTLESNVRQLHQFLFNNEDVKLSEDVTSLSNQIENFTGLSESDAVDYGY